MIGRKYELEKKIEGRPAAAKLRQNDGDNSKPTETAERIAKEQNISPRTVERSADLYKAHEEIKKRSPEENQSLKMRT